MRQHLQALVPFLYLAAGAFALGCGGESDASDDSADDGDPGIATDEAATVSCKLARGTIVDNADGERRTALERGFSWFDAHVPYSQARSYQGYRTDCSGFVSMAWELGHSDTTATFSSGVDASRLGSYSSIEPGDAFLYRSGSEGHVMLFMGWNDSAHTSACVIEEMSPSLGIQFHAHTTSSLQAGGYHAIRAKKLQ